MLALCRYVDIEAGGPERIAVSGDGCGISAKDATVAFERQAAGTAAGSDAGTPPMVKS